MPPEATFRDAQEPHPRPSAEGAKRMVKHCLTHDGRIGESDGGNKKYELDSIHACLYCLRIVRTRSKSVEQND